MDWIREYAAQCESTDAFRGHPDHLKLLAAGLFGEAGSILAEAKKAAREEAYTAFHARTKEEIGDLLWYFVRLMSVAGSGLLGKLDSEKLGTAMPPLDAALRLGSAAARLVDGLYTDAPEADRTHAMNSLWQALLTLGSSAGIDLAASASANVAKVRSRWPASRAAHRLFDEEFAPEEQLPRRLVIDFVERERSSRKLVLLRYGEINIGDRLTDNILDPDGYRFHDIFHFAHAVYLGWSPVTRGLLRCKRKSIPTIDENQDGARPAILEEAIAATVFSRAKAHNFFEHLRSIDYDLLKAIQELTRGYEVEEVPLWQWEEAILEGFRAFRALRTQNGGRVVLDFRQRTLVVQPLPDVR